MVITNFPITVSLDARLMAIFQDNLGKLASERFHSGFYRSWGWWRWWWQLEL